ncbi:Vacuolar amino acid transporter 1 [Venturia nashicola]|uniref:ferric-chelate reductase (NADPH) n=1 Tax=Venturia nashicola TaxID=86259 RepID=A0A4Z1NME0_9PEZI|nr:Vacuolar amino acid transporter 1 [Venturia nashicola]
MGPSLHKLIARINVPSNKMSPAGLIEANTRDPFNKSGKYALGWVYFGIILLALTSALYIYHAFTDRIRAAMYEDEVFKSSTISSPAADDGMAAMANYYPYPTDKSTNKIFNLSPLSGNSKFKAKTQSSLSASRPLHIIIAAFRYIFYRPLPEVRLRKGWKPITLPAPGTAVIVFAGLAFSILYTFLPQPLFWKSIQYGSPPMAIRAGMLAVALLPWVTALAMKASVISLLTGIGHERLNVFHRWGAYLMLLLSIIHTIPFYVTPLSDAKGLAAFKAFFQNSAGFYIYGSGIAALVPLCFLCVHSLPMIRHKVYELFLLLHWPIAMVYVGMMFWHCHNYLTSWSYLWATVVIWGTSWLARIFFWNFSMPWRVSFLVGDECALTILPENAVKITIPTQKRWRPGQFVYIRMPGISIFENHPFTIASLCSDDFPSEYGEGYRDMLLVFRPFGGFTRKALNKAIKKGPWDTYRAFIDGPYGGMRRRLESFDTVVLIAGGSGITAIASQLLDLIKRMRDGKAVTQKVEVIWALKRPETMEWFKEELRICRECAPPEAVTCQFYITGAKRFPPKTHRMTAQTTQNRASVYFHDKINDALMGVADKRSSYISQRNSVHIREEAGEDKELEEHLRTENEDIINPLPRAHVVQTNKAGNFSFPISPNRPSFPPAPSPDSPMREHNQGSRDLSLDIQTALQSGNAGDSLDASAMDEKTCYEFGFPSTPTEFQKNLMRFAFLPAATKAADGWSTEYGRPDLPYQLRQLSKTWGKRTCVFVCGPPGMRVVVAKQVAELQKLVLRDSGREEIFMHAENYAI